MLYTNFMHDLLTIGNISIDMFFKVGDLDLKDDRFQLAVGGKYHADSLSLCVGGGGANVAIGTAKQGLTSAVLSIIGENGFKKMILDELDSSGVATQFCKYKEDYLNISSILLSSGAKQTITHFASPFEPLIEAKIEYEVPISVRGAYLGNISDVSLDTRTQLLKFFHTHDITTFVNLGVKDCRRSINELAPFLAEVRVLIVNAHELSDIVKTPYEQINFSENLLETFPLLKGKLVIVTDGKKGSFGYTEEGILRQEALEPELIADPTGAGDGYTSGFIAEYLRSQDVRKSMESGAQYAKKILAKIGAN